MAIGIHKRDSVVGIMAESTEKTYEAPSGTSKYMQVEPDFSVKVARDEKAREFITGSIGMAKPLKGMKSAEMTLTFEARGAANGGIVPDYGPIFKSCFGSEVARTVDRLTTTGSTTTTVVMDTGLGSNFAVGDMILIAKGSGNSSVRFVTGISTDTLTVAPALAAGEVPGSGVNIVGAVTYKPADSGHTSLSVSVYWANQIREAVIGGKVSQLSLSAWEVGEIPKFSATIQGLTYTRTDGAAPHTPAYINQLPPVVLAAYVYQDATAIQIKGVSLSIDQELSKTFDVMDADGATKQFVTKRSISGSINPYLDDTSVANFTLFNANTNFSLLVVIGNKDSNDDLVEGSVVGIYLPRCIVSENAVGDDGGILMENLSFKAHRGDEGTSDEIYLGVS